MEGNRTECHCPATPRGEGGGAPRPGFLHGARGVWLKVQSVCANSPSSDRSPGCSESPLRVSPGPGFDILRLGAESRVRVSPEEAASLAMPLIANAPPPPTKSQAPSASSLLPAPGAGMLRELSGGDPLPSVLAQCACCHPNYSCVRLGKTLLPGPSGVLGSRYLLSGFSPGSPCLMFLSRFSICFWGVSTLCLTLETLNTSGHRIKHIFF